VGLVEFVELVLLENLLSIRSTRDQNKFFLLQQLRV
jgi:hypothetical protein